MAKPTTNPEQVAQRRVALGAVIEQRRKELSQRPDVSARMRTLSESSGRHPMPTPPKQRSRILPIILGVVGVVALLACALSATAAIAGGLWFQGQINSPATTAEDYFTAVHQEDYPRAYTFLSANDRRHTSQATFTTQMRNTDIVQGGVIAFTTDSTTTSGAKATVTMDVVRNSSPTVAQVLRVTLVSENGSWRIDSIAQVGTEPAPTPAS
ncbi:MAG: hypothetical protein ABI068_15345 [Ktedonobacterales bacterium]